VRISGSMDLQIFPVVFLVSAVCVHIKRKFNVTFKILKF
jgi:hypothetical protein